MNVVDEMTAINVMGDAIELAIKWTQDRREGPYGIFDYTAYGEKERPFHVRDFTRPAIPENYGQPLFRCKTRREAEAIHAELMRIYYAKIAFKALRKAGYEIIDPRYDSERVDG